MALNLSGNEHAYPFIIGNTKLPYFLTPYYNPNKFDISTQKEYDRTQTIGGQVFEHWGKKPPIMHVETTILKNDFAGGYVGIYKNAQFDDPLFCSELDAFQRLFEMDQRYIKNLTEARKDAQFSKDKVKSRPVVGTLNGLASGALYVGNHITSRNIPVVGSINDMFSKFTDTIIYYKLNIYSGFFISMKVEEDGKLPFTNKVTFDFLITSTISDYLNEWLATTTSGRMMAGVLGGVSAATTLTSIIDSVGNGLTNTIKNQISGIKNG